MRQRFPPFGQAGERAKCRGAGRDIPTAAFRRDCGKNLSFSSYSIVDAKTLNCLKTHEAKLLKTLPHAKVKSLDQEMCNLGGGSGAVLAVEMELSSMAEGKLQEGRHRKVEYALFFIFCLLSFPSSTARDTITPKQNVTDGETLVSGQKVFELGFFSPDEGSLNKRYLGIWYYGIQPRTVIWVANREKPVLDYHGVFAMRNNGELQVVDGKGQILWSSAYSTPTAIRVFPAATLMDNGNLVLQGVDNPWESYKQESNTFLPGMNMENKFLRSWKSGSDPAPGDFTFEVNKRWNQFMIRNRSSSDPYWESGWSPNLVNFNEVPNSVLEFMFRDNNFSALLIT
ncbi:hypothetical protein SLEP1_g39631 [Rubroshorea leprosula]|uniref:Bulb-type lectin domain-containing protein n=1 Tax=Rubroshorea leprosula TaxID=152421 RepID=A0AAV5L124_9ROSI|nr:hypothetical protein SLEP1_g39631 [Rubroshorea leprosula]